MIYIGIVGVRNKDSKNSDEIISINIDAEKSTQGIDRI
jgi:hypothetical protein